MTSIKKMEAAYENSRRLAFIGEMAAGLAHEIRNPLAAISGSIQMLRKDLTLEPTDERLMKIILRGKDQLENFMRDFLLLAKPAAGHRERVALNELIDEILESLAYLPDWKEKITAERSFSAPVMLWANKAEIQQVVWNLILNALQAIPREGCLSIRTAQPEIKGGRQWVQLCIEDDGKGFPQKTRSGSFSLFLRPRKGEPAWGWRSLGGLLKITRASSRSTVNREEGRSSRPIFRPVRKLSKEIGPISKMSGRPEGAGEKGERVATILVVDEDKGVREFLEIMLTREGYEVNCARDAKEALNRSRKQPFDLIITDLKMPGMDGTEFLHSVKEISPESLVILITTYASGETVVRATKEGAYDYVQNFNIEDFTATIRSAMESKGNVHKDAQFIREIENAVCFGELIGKSREMLKVYSLIKKVAETTANVLILGESGTGKELVSKGIH